MSRSPAQRVYPFSMDNGVPLNCKWYGGIQSCSTSERWAGLYEVSEAARVRLLFAPECGAAGGY